MRHMTPQQYEEAMATLNNTPLDIRAMHAKWLDHNNPLLDLWEILLEKRNNLLLTDAEVVKKYFLQQPVQLVLPLEF